jgi:hypothetical protein
VPRSLGPELPASVRSFFEGEDLDANQGVTFLLLTMGADGWPHQAMVSVGEVLMAGADTIRVGLWLTSTATRNLTREGRGVLTFVHNGAGYTIRCDAHRMPDLDLGTDGRLAAFVLRIKEVLEDRVSYATLTSGFTYRLPEPDQVLPRWRKTVDALRGMDQPAPRAGHAS